jgi:hypothetical protein
MSYSSGGVTAPTPAFHDGAAENHEAAESSLPNDWLTDPSLNHLTNGTQTKERYINVIFNGTNITNYRDGVMEKKTARVISVLNPSQHGMTTIEATATVAVDDSPNEPNMTVPVKYLKPVIPQDGYTYTQVVALAGRFKGELLRLRDYGEEQCSVSNTDELYDEVPTSKLATLSL